MKWACISVHQPWARHLAIGHKTIENRGWYNPYRGLLFIHATKQDAQKVGFVYAASKLAYGAIIGYAYLREIFQYKTPKHFANYTDQHYCIPPEDYEWQCYAWVFSAAHEFKKPVKCRGYRKIWYVAHETRAAVYDQMKPVDRGVFND